MSELTAGQTASAKRVVLHVGCGPRRHDTLHPRFQTPGWRELRLDIDERVQPDLVASVTSMPAVANASADAVWCSHNLEHLHPDEVPLALAEFRRVLKPGGFALIAVPDLQAAAELVVADRAGEVAYSSPAGPITALDLIYGFRGYTRDNPYMLHRTGFTARTLIRTLAQAGFARVQVERRQFELLAEALNTAASDTGTPS
ncbi:MAG: methyltransferase domain-containing protein [Planctomycetia bacterium]|nr:methyltransferase domain-containing protein [Planctomycetia bacterium]